MQVFLLSSKTEDKVFFEAAAKIANLDFMLVATPEQLCDRLLQDGGGVVVVDASSVDQYKKFEKCVSDKIGLFSAIINSNHVFFVGSSELHDSSFLIQSEIFGSFIPRLFTAAEEARIGRLFGAATAEKAFGIERYFGANPKIQIVPITKSVQKRPIVEALKNELVKLGFQSRVGATIATAVDELIMNAIYDAPTDETGKMIYAQTPRSTPLELGEKDAVELKLVFDGDILGISVQDPHGSLDKKKLLNHIGKSYQSDQFKVKTTVAGAGLGLANVYRNCGGLVFACEMGIRTQVMLFYKKTKSFKEFKDQFRFLTTFMYFS